jgi:hypothetical protein
MIAPVSEEATSAPGEPAPAKEAATPKPAQSGLEALAGAYDGQLWSNGEMRPGRVELGVSSTSWGGLYTFEQDGQIYTGELLDCELSNPVELLCAWRDDFGTGHASLIFEEDLRGFAGSFWSDGGEDTPHPWTGARSEP